MAQLKVKQISDFVTAVASVHNGTAGTQTTADIAAAKSQAISSAVSADVLLASDTDVVASGLSNELLARASGDTDAIASALSSSIVKADAAQAAAELTAESKDVVRAGAASTATAAVATDLATVATDLASELVTRAADDSALSGRIITEKDRIDAILLASNANADTFAEVVTLINSVDTTNDSAFAGYVTSNNAALSTELVARADGDAAAISTAASDATAKADAAQAAAISAAASDATTKADAAESSAISSAEAKDAARAATAATNLSNAISTEVSDRNTAIGVLDNDLQTQINALTSVANEEEIAVFRTITSFGTVATYDLNGHVAVFVNGLQVHEAVGAGDGWISADGINFTVQGLGYDLEAGDHIIVTGKLV